jgi:hypothetical protein
MWNVSSRLILLPVKVKTSVKTKATRSASSGVISPLPDGDDGVALLDQPVEVQRGAADGDVGLDLALEGCLALQRAVAVQHPFDVVGQAGQDRLVVAAPEALDVRRYDPPVRCHGLAPLSRGAERLSDGGHGLGRVVNANHQAGAAIIGQADHHHLGGIVHIPVTRSPCWWNVPATTPSRWVPGPRQPFHSRTAS